MLSLSSFPVVSLPVSMYETAIIPIISSISEAVVVIESLSSSPTTHITFPMPFPIVTQTSSLVSMVAGTSSTTKLSDEFNVDIVFSLGDYHYSKSNKELVKKVKMRSIYQSDMDTSLSNQTTWTQQSGDPQLDAANTVVALGAFIGANFHVVNTLN